MNLSDITELIENINNDTGQKLRYQYEISLLINTSLNNSLHEEFKELLFSAKYVKGLKKVLADRTINRDKYMENMFEEFNLNLQKVIEMMKLIVEKADNVDRKNFNDKYFSLDHQSIVNSLELIEDLSICKQYFNNHPDAISGLYFRHSK